MKRLKKDVQDWKHQLSHHFDKPEFGSIFWYPLMEISKLLHPALSRTNLDIVWLP
jgi:hypothetical protein